ncbi:hypothetical protein AB0L85_15285 [Streptomyces sp. NPDC052051]|uniref:hypothetical protein n=1 Tax=Streptomyces sp. NPDC052051 TaxID=3154649 RepID=UPI00342070FA
MNEARASNLSARGLSWAPSQLSCTSGCCDRPAKASWSGPRVPLMIGGREGGGVRLLRDITGWAFMVEVDGVRLPDWQ